MALNSHVYKSYARPFLVRIYGQRMRFQFISFSELYQTFPREKEKAKQTENAVGNKNADEIIKWSRVTPSVFNGITFSRCCVAVNRFQYTLTHAHINCTLENIYIA